MNRQPWPGWEKPDEMVREIYLCELSRAPSEREAQITGDMIAYRK